MFLQNDEKASWWASFTWFDNCVTLFVEDGRTCWSSLLVLMKAGANVGLVAVVRRRLETPITLSTPCKISASNPSQHECFFLAIQTLWTLLALTIIGWGFLTRAGRRKDVRKEKNPSRWQDPSSDCIINNRDTATASNANRPISGWQLLEITVIKVVVCG